MKRSRTLWLPSGVLLVALALTWLVWHHERQSAQLQLKTHFEYSLQETVSRIEQRMAAYEQLLRGVQAQYAVVGRIDRESLQKYIAILQLDPSFSGIQAVGRVDWVPAAQREHHLAKMRHLGFGDYRITPDGLRDNYGPIVQREPYSGLNRAPVGFDAWADPSRRQAMERARDAGMPALSGKLGLSIDQGPEKQPGVVMYLPLYTDNQANDTLEQRRAKLNGWVFASFRMSDLMANLYGQQPPGVSFSLHDGIDISPQTLLYQSGTVEENAPNNLSANEYLVIGGRTWTLTMVATDVFAQRFGRNDAPLIAWSGIGLSLLLALVALLLTTSRARALKLAQIMTRELQASEHFMHTVADNTPGLVAYWCADLRCKFANAPHLEYFGKSKIEIPGMHLRDVLGEARFSEQKDRIQAVLRGEVQKFEGTLTKPDGSTTYTYVHLIPDRQNDQVMGFYLFVSDITPLKEVEAELANHRNSLEAQVRERTIALSIAKDAAEAANRAKTVFLATMSHELRTPMNAIMGLTGIVKRNTTDPRQIDQLGKILAASNQLLNIINDILELSRIEADAVCLDQVDFMLSDILEKLTATFKPEAQRKDLSFDVHIAPQLATQPLRGDPARLEQILFKLTSNAIKFTAAGSIIIRAMQLEATASGSFVRFEVADTGIGIPIEEQGRLFSAFEQLDGSSTRRYGGTGLGLAISKRLVEAMEGTIGVDSHIGAGSVFWFTAHLGRVTDEN